MQIHELNTFTGLPGGTDFLAIDTGFDTAKIGADKFVLQNGYGIAGQLLRTKGNGETEWVDEGLPTDEQTAEAVTAWLNDHPEATTTVLDGSLSYKKLIPGTLGFVTPEMFGAEGDGVSDDSDAVEEAFSHDYVVCKGTYKITRKITVNASVIRGEGSFVYGGAAVPVLFDFIGQTNIYVSGLSVDGNNLVGKCFNIDDSASRNTVIFENNTISNLNCGTNPLAAIKLEDRVKYAAVVGNTIRNIHNDSSSIVVTEGVAITQLDGVAEIANNTIEGVITASSQDSDGIKVFTLYKSSGTEDVSSILIVNNIVQNCNGRGVKIQGANAYVQDNYFCLDGITVINRPAIIETQTDGIVIENNKFYLSNLTIKQSKVAITRQTIVDSSPNVRAMNTVINGNAVFADASCLSFFYLDLGIVDYPVAIAIKDNYINTPNCYPFRLIAYGVNNRISINVENNMIFADPWIHLSGDLASTNAGVYPTIAENVSITIKNNINLQSSIMNLFYNTYLSIYKLQIQGNINANEQIYGYGWALSKLGNTRCYFDSDGLNSGGGLTGLPSGMDAKYAKSVLVEGITQQASFCVVRLSYITNTAPFENVVVARVYKP